MAREEKKVANLVRIMGCDINTESTILFGLSHIKGISIMFSNAVCNVLKLNKYAKISSLSEKDIEKLEEYLSNPKKEGIPTWLLNQRKDLETGLDHHLIAKDIEFNLMQHKRRHGKLKTYKGIRYKTNLPVRGQRTGSNFRHNKTLAAMKAKSGGKK